MPVLSPILTPARLLPPIGLGLGVGEGLGLGTHIVISTRGVIIWQGVENGHNTGTLKHELAVCLMMGNQSDQISVLHWLTAQGSIIRT